MFRLFQSDKRNQRTSSAVDSASPAQSYRSEQSPRGRRGRSIPEELAEPIIAAIRTVYDPEIPVNVYDLGLIYALEIENDSSIKVRMTLTAPACPVAGSLPAAVAEAVRRVPGVSSASVDLVFDPPWSSERMSETAKLQLGLD